MTANAPIPFIDLKAQRHHLGGAIDAAVTRVLDHGQFILGPEVRELESQLAAFCGARHALTCSSGTDALMLVLLALRHRAGRRGVLPVLHLLRHRRGGGAARRHAGVRRRRCRHLQHEPGGPRARHRHRQAAGPEARRVVIPVDLFGLPADYDDDPADRRAPRPVGAVPTPPRASAPAIAAAASAPSASPPPPASSRPSRSAATATAARCSPTTTG